MIDGKAKGSMDGQDNRRVKIDRREGRLMMSGLICIVCLLLAFGFAAPAGSAEKSLEQAKQLLEEGDPAGARAVLEPVLEGDSENHVALSYLGKIALAEGDFDGAIDLLKRAAELDETDSGYRTWLGRAYILKLQTVTFFEKGVLAGRAQEQLQKAITLDPTNVQARIFLAQYYVSAPSIAGGSTKKAREQAEEIIKHDPVEGNALLAGIHVRDEEYDLAIDKYEQCIESQPDNVTYRYQLAMLYQKLEHFDLSLAGFEKMLEIDPEATSALYQIGRTAVFSKTNLDRGIECLQSYLKKDVKPGHPGYDAAHWRLGMLFEHKGDLTRAREEYETALRLNPDGEEYRKSLASLDQE